MEEEWKSISVVGISDFAIKEKFKILKGRLKKWNSEVLGKVILEVEDNKVEINSIDTLLACCKEEQVEGLVASRNKATSNLWWKLESQERILVHKSSLRWRHDGDLNSAYFHNFLKDRRRRNFIESISLECGLFDSVREVKEEVRRHFFAKFMEPETSKPTLDGKGFKSLSDAENASLEEDKSRLIEDFHSKAQPSKAITSSFLTLVPKSNSPSSFDGYRHIFLVGSLYKILRKFLAGRLKKLLGSLIAGCQTAFVPGRELLDGVLIANEIADFSTRENKDCLLFKVDFEKAYDMVNCNVSFRIGDGSSISFLSDCWVCDDPLKVFFPELYLSSSLKDAKVSEMGGLADGYWVWGCFGFLEQVLVNEVPS
ncbi:uncharacterized protein LOC127131080 [Lathyrus oleraceus]|uniref:uncharacterized protein LOC127131080 n=1 Tax=Pisum sativum TaxID=3888 RepID=UPI0021CE8256|nr:uncharacterized protein LOC127131080 [Pisum sativum]